MRRFSVVLALAVLAGGSVAWAQPTPKIEVKTADDLPRHRYKVEGKALELITDDAKFRPLLDHVLADTLDDLQKYDIKDPSTLRGYYDFIAAAYTVKGDLSTALEYTLKAKDLETKDQEKLMRGQALQARIAALKVSKDESSEPFAAAFKAELKRNLQALPFEPIKDRMVAIRAQSKMVTRQLVEASVSNQLDPIIDANKGEIPAEIASSIVSTRATLDYGLRLLPLMAEVYGDILDEHANAQAAADLWTPRLVSLPADTKATPVVVGIWDSGVDTSLYPNQLWTNPAEKADGKDDDHNGFVDDIHGIAFGEDHTPTTGPLASLAGLKGDKQQRIDFLVASQDMQTGVTNPGVEAFQNYMKSLTGDALKDFTDDMSLIGGYVHGTHVAGIASAGNPFARLLHITENWPYKAIPDHAPTIEEGKAWGDSMRQAVAYLKKANVRVVNMSWRVGRSAFEGMLEAKGVGKTAEERAELSRKIFAEMRQGLEEAIKSAPDILFVAGSGNEDNDVDFAEYIPAGLRLPNLLTVGAVDDHDKMTTFSTTGKNVELYANGYRVESMIPGGRKVNLSGTSMAAPQVTNLAAKIIALKPTLTPQQVIDAIKSNADPLPGQPGRYVIDPKKTIAAIQH